jgi:hypothetical protein
MKFTLTSSLIAISVVLTACAPARVSDTRIEDGIQALSAKDAPTAYQYFEQHIEKLSVSPEADLATVRQYVQSNPELLSYGQSQFEAESLYADIEKYGKSSSGKIARNRLAFFKKIAPNAMYGDAKSCVEQIFDGLQGECSRELAYGVIVDAQTVNKSTKNTGAGAQLGSVYGQAAYIDNTSVYDYSATSQVNSAIVGALVGSLLLDKPSQQRFDTTYYVRTNAGDMIEFKRIAKEPLHIPVGTCVEFKEPHYLEPTNQKRCP